MRNYNILLFLCIVGLIALCGCRQQRTTFRVIQAAAAPYQIYLMGPPDQPARLGAASGFNLSFMAAAGDVDFTVQVYAPVSPAGSSTKIWEHRFHYTTGHQAWQIVVSSEEDKEFIQMVPSTWKTARTSLIHLPTDGIGPDLLTEPGVEASPRFELYLRR